MFIFNNDYYTTISSQFMFVKLLIHTLNYLLYADNSSMLGIVLLCFSIEFGLYASYKIKLSETSFIGKHYLEYYVFSLIK